MNEKKPKRYRDEFPRTMRLKSALTAFVFASLPVLPFFLLLGNLLFIFVNLIVLWAVLIISVAVVYGVLLSFFYHKTLIIYRPDKKELLRRRMIIIAGGLVWLFLAYGIALSRVILPAYLLGVAG